MSDGGYSKATYFMLDYTVGTRINDLAILKIEAHHVQYLINYDTGY